ncbi:MAG: SemiSWEET transporter [Calditrichaceae bacterium]|nr:SemiSWEET transporter [Calditrichaceae bacterium]
MEAISIVGFTAAVFTTISFLPQVIKIIKTKHTKDLSLGMYAFFVTGVLLWFVYGFLIYDIPVIIANGITLLLSTVILIYIIKYSNHQPAE